MKFDPPLLHPNSKSLPPVNLDLRPLSPVSTELLLLSAWNEEKKN
jgi:hypothetical protein